MSERIGQSGNARSRIAEWHRWLTGRTVAADEGPDDRQADGTGNTGALADLRRCVDARDVMLTYAFGRLIVSMHPTAVVVGTSDLHPDDISALARTALILSRVDRCGFAAPHFGKVPWLMASAVGERKTSCVSLVRASVLFSAPDADEACRCLLGLLPLLQGGSPKLDPGDVHFAMRWWDKARRSWAMDYYAMAPRDAVS